MLEPIVVKKMKAEKAKLDRQGMLLSLPKLVACRDLFRQKFGPNALSSVDGEALLELMHGHGNQNSLVYWLEFKDDEEFPYRFGSISGGSALKFGLYRRKETGEWMTGASKDQRQISTAEAVDMARNHRSQLTKGCAVFESFVNQQVIDYSLLQQELTSAAPDLADTAWGHKYFSILYPENIDDFHNSDYQRFHLIKILVQPPQKDGRYVCAGLFVEASRELDWHMNHLTSVMNSMNGSPHAYWRIGTTHGDSGQSEWDNMRNGNYVAVGWPDLGDLSHLTYSKDSKEQLRELFNNTYPNENPSAVGRSIQQIFNFATTVSVGDIVLACDGASVQGIGRITGDYEYDKALRFPNKRPIEWLSLDKWKMPSPEGLRTTVFRLHKYPVNLVEAERRFFSYERKAETTVLPELVLSPLTGFLGRIEVVIERKGQVILYGPPGTGKTYWAEKAVLGFAARKNFSKNVEALTVDEQKSIDPAQEKSFVRICCFHPSYGYEDFVEGYRPKEMNGQMVFSPRNGIFKAVCNDALNAPNNSFYLFIDEVNRGDIPRIFGELIMLIEKGKRGKYLTLPLSGERFCVPPNLFIIGTMNTADRSIALLDTALRRRFGFIELMPDYDLLSGAVIAGVPISQWLRSLNKRIRENIGKDSRNIQVGHSYFMEKGKAIQTLNQLQRVIREDIIPLLQEYCYEDFAVLERLLGPGFVDGAGMVINNSVCDIENSDVFVAALLRPDTSIQATTEAVEAEAAVPDNEADSDEPSA